ncbi:MAG: LUD domain-containing protein [Pseudomonadota bacterium]
MSSGSEAKPDGAIGASKENGAANRSKVLGTIRSALTQEGGAQNREANVAQRLSARGRNLIPARVDRDREGLTALFIQHLEGQSATVVRVDESNAVPNAIGRYLRDNNLPARLRAGDDAALGALPWEREPTLERESGAAVNGDEVGLTRAIAGVAETGTMLMASGADNPVTLNFIPTNHIVVIDEADIAPAYEDAFDAVRGKLGDRVMPRTLNMISGPSRTGDIGGILVRGAHGPKDMCVIIVNAAGAT